MAVKTNFDKFAIDLKRKSEEFIKEVEQIIGVNIGDMELMAIRLAKPNEIKTETGFISEKQAFKQGWRPIYNHIGSKEERQGNVYKGTVFVESGAGLVAIYREFGTGQSASSYLSTIPQEWRDVASVYIINKKGTIINQPYMYPSFMKYKEEFIKDLKEAITKFTKK